jgi:predicted enzyme related to lactoylglutathione lyase
MVPDVEAAKRFYGELFGWNFQHGDHDYEHINAGQAGVGGIMKLDPKTGAPPHWIGYVKVDDVDASVAAATKAGGKVRMPKMSVPNVGEFAVVADGQGAAYAPMKYTGKDANKPEPEGPLPAFHFCWDELMTSDPDAAVKFYTTVFGWGVEHMDMPGFGRYSLLTRPGTKDTTTGKAKNAGGVMKSPPGVPFSFWLPYVAVNNTDQSVEKAKRLGATITAPPADIPNIGRFAVMLDSQRVAIAIIAPKK